MSNCILWLQIFLEIVLAKFDIFIIFLCPIYKLGFPCL